MDYKTWYDRFEFAIANRDSQFLKENIKKLFDHARDPALKSIYPIFLLCRAELSDGSTCNIVHMIKLARLRFRDDLYAQYLLKYVSTYSVDKENVQKALLKMLKNPEVANAVLQLFYIYIFLPQLTIDLGKLDNPPLEDVEAIEIRPPRALIRACEALETEDYASSVELLTEFAEAGKNGGDAAEQHKMDLSVKFLTAWAQTHVGSQADLARALDTFKGLIGTKILRTEADVDSAGLAERVPMALLGLALLLQKTFRFKLGAKVVDRGLEIVERRGSKLPPYYWPDTDRRLKFSEPEFLKDRFLKLRKILKAPPKPDAVCRFDGCSGVDQSPIPIREIYVEDADFNGYTLIRCSNACQIAYHPNCWKTFKESVGSSAKMRDKDMMGKDCPTADCYLDLVSKRPGKIVKLVPYDKDNKSITVLEWKDPEPSVQAVPSAPPAPPKKKIKREPAPRAPQPNKTVEEKKVAVKSTKVNRGNAAPPFLKTPSVEQDETRLAASFVKERIPKARALYNRPTLLEKACIQPEGRNPHEMQLWFLFALDLLRNSSCGSISKDELLEAFQKETDVLEDLKLNMLPGEHKGLISKCEFVHHLLRSGEFGCIDDRICLAEKIGKTSEWVANDLQQLYKTMYKVQFLSFPPARKSEAKPQPQPPPPTIVCKTGSVKIQDAADYINTEFRKVSVAPVYNPIGTVGQPVSKKEPLQILKVEEKVEVKEKPRVAAVKLEPKDLNSVPASQPVSDRLEQALEQSKLEMGNLKKRVSGLEIALSKESVDLQSQKRTSDKLQMELNRLGVEHKKLKQESNDREKMLKEHLEKTRQEKEALAKQVKELARQNSALEKELNEKKKSLESSESAKGKKKKQDDICNLAIQRVIQLIEAHWQSVRKSYSATKAENEELVMSLLDMLSETSNPSYEDAMKNLQDWESVLDGVETSERTLRTRLGGVRDKSKGLEAIWASLSQIQVPRVADMPKCIITQACKDILKLQHHQPPPPAARALPPAPQPQPKPPPPAPQPAVEESRSSASNYGYAFRMDAQYNMPMPMSTSHERLYFDDRFNARPLLPSAFGNKVLNGERAMRSSSPPLRITRDCPSPTSSVSSTSSANCSEHSATSSAAAAATSAFLAALPSTSGMAAHFAPARAIVGKPFVSGNVGNAAPSRDLIPNSLRQHLQRVNVRPAPSLADALKKPEPPSIQVTPATRVPLSDLKIALSFTEQQQKLIALRKLIPYTHESDFKQALHWLCRRRGDVRFLTDKELSIEVCDVLTELLLNASEEELSSNRQDPYLMLDLPSDEPCSICLSPFRENDAPIHVLSCQHFFHNKVFRFFFRLS
ncbi:Hypothetical predicted protein [Cloeon dipterum]|nr:Hypothetical predicted protein [Cloeon dipterum]